ncbi:hypothetical protein LINPERHAP2_LOCUS5580 [Linum perenne]
MGELLNILIVTSLTVWIGSWLVGKRITCRWLGESLSRLLS